jgi:hypothetical protein
MENSRTMRRIILASNKVLATGYNEIPFAPPVPIQEIPTKAECQGYQFISMVQLCKIATEHNWSLHTACSAFGGDNGGHQVIPERQAWEAPHNNKPWKFVLLSAVEAYFTEIGIDW